MSKTAWQYSIYTTVWSSYVAFTSNPGKVTQDIQNISTVEYKRLIDGFEVDVVPEVKYLKGEVSWTWLYQRSETLYDLINGWYINHTPIRIKDDRANVYEGYFVDVIQSLPPRKSYSDGTITFMISTKFKQMTI